MSCLTQSVEKKRKEKLRDRENQTTEMNVKQDLELQSDHSSDQVPTQHQQPPRRLRGFAATAAAGADPGGLGVVTKGKKEREKEKERTKLRERHRRAITSRMLAGLRQYGNFTLPARADMNDVLAALAREAGWTVETDGTTYRPSPSPAQLATIPSRSIESPLSATTLKNCAIKASLDCQPSVLRIDESLSPASLDSVVVAEKDMKSDKYANTSPINSPECFEADQLMRDVHPGDNESDFMGTPYIPVYVMLPVSRWCLLLWFLIETP